MRTTARRVLARLRVPLGALGAFLLLSSPALARGRVALIVNESNPLSAVTSAELRKIFLGDETRWPGNRKITILLLPQGSEERKSLLKSLLKMSDDDFVRHWISRVFQGEATAGPKIAPSPASMVKLVAGLPSAVGMLDADDVPAGASGLKVLRVDGKGPNDDGYPLTR
jgi:phosphate transport system substrate-binding protein